MENLGFMMLLVELLFISVILLIVLINYLIKYLIQLILKFLERETVEILPDIESNVIQL